MSAQLENDDADLAGEFEQLDIHAVAQQLSCSLKDVIDHVNAGRLAAYRMGDTVWFRSSDVAALV